MHRYIRVELPCEIALEDDVSRQECDCSKLEALFSYIQYLLGLMAGIYM